MQHVLMMWNEDGYIGVAPEVLECLFYHKSVAEVHGDVCGEFV